LKLSRTFVVLALELLMMFIFAHIVPISFPDVILKNTWYRIYINYRNKKQIKTSILGEETYLHACIPVIECG
jgi:hypothetical protein